MLTFERTQDLELVRSILTHPRIYPWISDDGAPAAADFQPVDHPAIWYVLVKEQLCGGDRVLGLFLFTPQGAACWEVHTCLLPIAWGRRAAAAAAGAAEWLFEQTSCSRIVTTVPAYNRLALRFARAAGMTEYGRNPASYLKNGKLHDQVLLGLSRED
jgi:RimJ/RimL family protein N-acetyltransferase